MQPEDALLVQLADPGTRPSLLTSDELLEVALVQYDLDPGQVVGDTTAVFDSLELGAGASTTISGSYGLATDPLLAELRLSMRGAQASGGADAVWTGDVVLRLGTGEGVISAVGTSVLARDSGGRDRLAVDLTFADSLGGVPAAQSPLVLPVVVGFLVPETEDLDVRGLLRRTDSATRALERAPIRPLPPGAPPRRREHCICWLLPAHWFDDDDWPGGDAGNGAARRDARLARARSWLREQGIAVVTH